MAQDLPPDIQQKIKNIQGLQNSLQSLSEQKFSLEVQLKEVETAKEYLKNVDGNDPIYKNVGGLMIKTTKNKALEDLKNNEEFINVRIKKINMNIERTQARFESSKKEIDNALKTRFGAQ
ncbi:MAG: prefoldin subunit beta [Promethearchaeota archaeon]